MKSVFIVFSVFLLVGGLSAQAGSPLPPEARVLACQNREQGITQRSQQLTQTAEQMLQTFTTIAMRVQAHYVNTVLPSGKTIATYDELIADISAKQQAVGPLIVKATETVKPFGCISDNPKKELEQFRIDMQAVKQALENYRNSIRTLIIAINTL